jgi:membrane protein DedA with SNARE-associated domain/rhodanese-related sulfurtransferase
MNESTEFLLHHGYAILFLAVLAEQIGLPFPSSPLLLAAGALAGLHRLNPFLVLTIALSASLISDSVWYLLGRKRGSVILSRLCQISLEPDTCVSRMHTLYFRFGENTLLFCKFVPELGTLGPPMAGIMGLAAWKFLVMDAGGALLWSGTFFTAGWILRTQLEILGAGMAKLGTWFAIVLVAAVLVYVAAKYVQRQRFYRSLRIARITPLELKQRMEARESLVIVDLRDPIERRDGYIPGSIRLQEAQLDTVIPKLSDTEAILYCSCPNEAASARAALRLKREGVRRVRPLEGGFERWRQLGFPVEQCRAFGTV